MRRVYDLSKEEGCFSPLPVSGRQRQHLQSAVLGAIRNVPGSIKSIMSTYSVRNTEWDIPPLYSGKYGEAGLYIAPDTGKREHDPAIPFITMILRFSREGFSKTVSSMLERRVGAMASHPVVFDRDNRHPGRLAVEYVTALLRIYRYGLVMTSDTFAIRVPDGEDFRLMGIEGGVITGTDIRVSEADLFEWLLMPRGTVVTVKYGVYDRILFWAEKNFEDVRDVDKFRLALSLLKLSQDPNLPYCPHEAEFEAKLRHTTELRVAKSGMNGPLTYERFAEIRAIWLEVGDKSVEECFLDLFSALVPDIYDSEKFRKMFGKLPELDDKLTMRMLSRIDKGVETFTAEFSRMKEKV